MNQNLMFIQIRSRFRIKGFFYTQSITLNYTDSSWNTSILEVEVIQEYAVGLTGDKIFINYLHKEFY